MSLDAWNFRIQHILESAERNTEYTLGMSFDEFSSETRTFDAVLRNLEIMGEAASNGPQDFQDQHSGLPWHEMISIRNIIAHGYFNIDLDIIWSTIHNDVRPVVPLLRSIMASLKDEQQYT